MHMPVFRAEHGEATWGCLGSTNIWPVTCAKEAEEHNVDHRWNLTTGFIHEGRYGMACAVQYMVGNIWTLNWEAEVL